jgi:hypothetical protein
MDYLIRLDISNAMPIFRDYLILMNELVEHPDQVPEPRLLKQKSVPELGQLD